MIEQTWGAVQVPLGTVVHKLNPVQEDDEGLEPFTFQQHWVGSRDYVSSEDEASDCEHDSLEKASPSSPPNSEVTGIAAVLFLYECVRDETMLHM